MKQGLRPIPNRGGASQITTGFWNPGDLRISLMRKSRAIAVIIVAVLMTGAGFLSMVMRGSGQRGVEDPANVFTSRTGLPWPQSATVVHTSESHDGTVGDGETVVVLDVSPEVLKSWHASLPPWGASEWTTGTIPEYVVSLSFLSVPITSNLHFVTRERCCDLLPWRNGDFLGIELTSGRVWLVCWDY